MRCYERRMGLNLALDLVPGQCDSQMPRLVQRFNDLYQRCLGDTGTQELAGSDLLCRGVCVR